MAEVDAVVPNTSDAMEGIEASAEPPSVPPEDEYSCETLYIQNLNEKIKPEGLPYLSYNDIEIYIYYFFFSVLKASLRGLFKSYGEVLDVVAHNNLRMRGQAFVSFPSAEIAKKAMKDVQRFPLYSKPMVRWVLFDYLGRPGRMLIFFLSFLANIICTDTL